MPNINENAVVIENLGRVTAYADAVAAGYTGTREEFAQDQANFAKNAQLAKTYAENAKTSADNAKASETITENNKIASESYTHGGTGSRTGEDIDNALYYYEQCKAASEGIAGALIPMGTLAFEDVPPVSTLANGYMYNISNDFVTTDDFVQGAGYQQTLGTNIYVLTHNGEKKFDILAGTPVTGIKGEKETVYRKGNVSLSAEDIGACSLDQAGYLQNEIDELSDTISKVESEISDSFNAEISYSAGEYTIYNNTLYKFNKEHIGEWNDADADIKTVVEEIELINSNLSTLPKTNLQPTTSTYGIVFDQERCWYAVNNGIAIINVFANSNNVTKTGSVTINLNNLPFRTYGEISSSKTSSTGIIHGLYVGATGEVVFTCNGKYGGSSLTLTFPVVEFI